MQETHHFRSPEWRDLLVEVVQVQLSATQQRNTLDWCPGKSHGGGKHYIYTYPYGNQLPCQPYSLFQFNPHNMSNQLAKLCINSFCSLQYVYMHTPSQFIPEKVLKMLHYSAVVTFQLFLVTIQVFLTHKWYRTFTYKVKDMRVTNTVLFYYRWSRCQAIPVRVSWLSGLSSSYKQICLTAKRQYSCSQKLLQL